MRADNDSSYIKNQCSLVIRIDGDEIEIPVTFGMTADEIRMIYPFLLPLLNDKILNPAVQFVKANEQGLLADLSEEDYRNELLRVTEQSKYWYDKPSAGILDIAVRFAVDLKMKGIEDLDFIFNRGPVYDPMKIKPLSELEANVIMEKLHIVGDNKDLDTFAELGAATYDDSSDEEIEQHEIVRKQKESDTKLTEGVSDIISEADRQDTIKNQQHISDIFGRIRDVDSESDIFADVNIEQPDESKYVSKYDPNAKFSESDIHNGRIAKFEAEEEAEAREKEQERKDTPSAASINNNANNSYNSLYNEAGLFDDDPNDEPDYDEPDEPYYDEPDEPDDDGLNLGDFDDHGNSDDE